MNKLFIKALLLLAIWGILTPNTHAQKQTPLDIALRYLEQNFEKWQLDKSDIADMAVNNEYQTKHNGVTHLYLMQRHQNIRVYNAIAGVHITSDGKVAFATNRFTPNLQSKINAVVPLLTSEQAILKAATALRLPGKAAPVYLSKTEKGELIFEDKMISRAPIKVQLMYQPMPDGSVRLAWDLNIEELETSDHWSVRIDALNGDLLSKDNWTVYCHFDDTAHQHSDDCNEENFVAVKQAVQQQNLFPNDGASYNVYAFPTESPLHGDRQILVNPADPIASPFGWHDTNGQIGPEYTITRGNNTHTFADKQGNNISADDEPNGGATLIFDFPFNQTSEPSGYTDAATTQLFYLNNFMHDFSYHYGFDEPAGNFQQNNYGNGGSPSDYVIAQSQDASGNNNANFSAPPDGANGRMQMFLWNRGGSQLLTITAPESIAGGYETGTASFGPAIGNTPITGQVVAAFDNSSAPNQACGEIVNASQIAGKIALIDRGNCFFEEKVNNAQRAGAIAVIICNFDNNILPMGNVGTVTDPTIPSVMLSSSDCQLIRLNLDKGVTITLRTASATGPVRVDGSFDNGIVAHEYGHGISTRLTGGPAISSCLVNDEEMGEGWSDFFTLVTTAKPEDAQKAKAIGAYAWNRDINGKGFRRLPYSTDMNINNQTYDDIIGAAVPHGVGEVWAGVLWDLYWKMVEVYGWDDDIYNGTGGNNKAIQLVMDGMKLQSCNPGYLDGRDAILAADFINNNGDNECLIWEVFARRGLGYDALQGSPLNAYDGRAGFATLPECVKTLKIVKAATPLIEAGDEITYTLTVTNHKEEATSGVVLTDELPEGTAYIAGSATGGAQVSVENGMIRFEVGNLPSGQERVFSYKVSTPLTNRSLRLYFDDMESGFTNWLNDVFEGADVWDVVDTLAFSGSKSLFVPNTRRVNDQIAAMLNPYLVTGDQPVLHFVHNYNTDPGLDGGIVQISTDNGNSWETLDNEFIRNYYFGRIAYTTFATPNLNAYTGNSSGFIDSYIDLSDYIGEEILIRFRFGSLEEDGNDVETATGWAVDDFEFMDMYNYQSEACVTSQQGDMACALAPEGGTIVKSGVFTSTEDIEKQAISVHLYPNPASDIVNLAISSLEPSEANIRIFSADGKLLQQQKVDLRIDNQLIPINISNLSDGFYFVEVKSGQSVLTKKMIVR
ncbi:MAG: T9SS-dependent M36 family metallopeptidase [Saprospiraceae bacterium]|nr:T9SS-dependent M36 family metallopeptidase [Saprospiraceae bacterium]